MNRTPAKDAVENLYEINDSAPPFYESPSLLPCPFCGNDAITFEPDENRNIVSCKLGHAHMRTIEGWNTRTVVSTNKEQL